MITLGFGFREVLSNTPEVASHNLLGSKDNVVYISPDGHKEAVYNGKTGELVTDPTNMGSYNYYDYRKAPMSHFIFDTLPWILWGNSPEDTSLMSQRIFAFIEDFKYGISLTFE